MSFITFIPPPRDSLKNSPLYIYKSRIHVARQYIICVYVYTYIQARENVKSRELLWGGKSIGYILLKTRTVAVYPFSIDRKRDVISPRPS